MVLAPALPLFAICDRTPASVSSIEPTEMVTLLLIESRINPDGLIVPLLMTTSVDDVGAALLL